VVLVRKVAKIRGNPVRDKVIRQIRKGKKKWKEAVEYGKRWYIESFFSAFKRWFGEYVISNKVENVKKELVFCIQGWYNKHADDGWSGVGVYYGGVDEDRGILRSGRP
jgi:hypothetical protein